jgi:hypothetical protein
MMILKIIFIEKHPKLYLESHWSQYWPKLGNPYDMD